MVRSRGARSVFDDYLRFLGGDFCRPSTLTWDAGDYTVPLAGRMYRASSFACPSPSRLGLFITRRMKRDLRLGTQAGMGCGTWRLADVVALDQLTHDGGHEIDAGDGSEILHAGRADNAQGADGLSWNAVLSYHNA